MKSYKKHDPSAAIACVMTLIAVATVFMTQSIFLEISQSFAMEMGQARFAFSIASLFYATTFFFIAPIVDTVNLPRLAIAGIALLAMAIFSASLVSRFSLFLVAMAMVGTGAALVPGAMFPYMTLIAPANKTGTYVGSIVASGTLGIVFGRVVLGIMTANFGWRASFRLLALGLVVLGITAAVLLIKNRRETPTLRETLGQRYRTTVKLMVRPEIMSLLGAGFLLFFGFLGMVTFLTYRLVAPPFNCSAGEVGWISLAGLTAIVAPFAGTLSQKQGVLKVMVPGLIICLAGIQLMGWSHSIVVITLGVLLLFLGVYCCQPLLFILVGQRVPRTLLGNASSLYILFCIGGGSLSSILLGPAWDAWAWPGITLICSISLAGSLVLLLGATARQAGSRAQSCNEMVTSPEISMEKPVISKPPKLIPEVSPPA
ncbi:MAG: MFS transporter [Desulfobacterium sp.]|nr:MFS transporter [Desulfobacterium sp.]